MKSNHERSNECLPPKKREIPPSTLPSESRSPMAPPPENVAWLVAGGSGSKVPGSSAQSDAPQYKPPSSASDSTRSVSSLPTIYTSPLSQTHVGGTVHYAQLPPNLQFIASPYGAPYASYMAPQLLPPPPPPPLLSSSSSQRLSSLPETHAASSQASKYDHQRASVRYASAMLPPPTASLQPHHGQAAHYTEVGSGRKEEGAVCGPRELHNGRAERSRRFGPTPEKAGKSHQAYEACQLLLPSDYAHDPATLRTSVMLMPNSHGGDQQPAPSRDSPGKTHLEKGGLLLGKPLNRTPSSGSNHSMTFPPPLSVDNLKAAIRPLSPQTVIQTTHHSSVDPLSVGPPPGSTYPQSPLIGYIAGTGSSRHAPISYHSSLQQHVLIAGTQPLIIPVSGSGLTTLETPTSQVLTFSTQAYRGETPDNPAGSSHQMGSGAAVQVQLHLPAVPSAAPAPPSSAAAAPPSLPAYFVKGSIIQLADGELKRVEELKTDDFIQSAEISSELKIDSSTVERIEGSRASPDFAVVQFSVGEHRSQVSVEVLAEYPFFVFGQGWSSCCPDRTTRLLELPCTKLSVGDVCISLTLKNLRNGSLTKTPPPEAVCTSSGHGGLLGAPKTLSGIVPQSCAGGGSGHGERENGIVAVENGDLGFRGRGSLLKEDPRKPIGNGRKRRWSAPEGRKVEKPEEPSLNLAKVTFIPHQMKVAIEGRSDLGK
ncbi:ataxin-1a [Vanacampus margaritifer]